MTTPSNLCANCGKIITEHIKEISNSRWGKIEYFYCFSVEEGNINGRLMQKFTPKSQDNSHSDESQKGTGYSLSKDDTATKDSDLNSNASADASQSPADNEEKFILDACCGGRMFWENKKHPNAIFQDIRKDVLPLKKQYGINFTIEPDLIGDYRNMEFEDKKFKMVIFDPPHLFMNETAWMAKKYGTLKGSNWKEDLKKGFSECWRVLDNFGTLIFKWNDNCLDIKEVSPLFPSEPIIFNKIGTKGKRTYWFVFMKIEAGQKSLATQKALASQKAEMKQKFLDMIDERTKKLKFEIKKEKALIHPDVKQRKMYLLLLGSKLIELQKLKSELEKMK